MSANATGEQTIHKKGAPKTMPRYYFDIIDSDGFTEDEVGVDHPDDAAARRAGVEALLDIARDELPKDGDQCTFKVTVRGSTGQPIYSAELTIRGQMA